MPTDAQKQTLSNAVTLIRSAEAALMEAIRASTDPVQLGKLNAEYNQLDSLLSQILHAQALADDAAFASATAALQQQAAALQSQEAQIKTVISDVGIAAQVVGYIVQVATFLASL